MTAVAILLVGGAIAMPFQGWADRSYMPTPPATVQLKEEPCPGSGGAEFACWGPHEIWIAPEHEHDRFIFLHELGHEFDYDRLDDPERHRYESLTHDPRPWPQVAEDFADIYSLCSMRRHVTREAWVPAGALPGQFERLCGFIRRAAKTAGAGGGPSSHVRLHGHA